MTTITGDVDVGLGSIAVNDAIESVHIEGSFAHKTYYSGNGKKRVVALFCPLCGLDLRDRQPFPLAQHVRSTCPDRDRINAKLARLTDPGDGAENEE